MELRELTKISIHAPLAGCDFICMALSRYWSNFNPRTPCGVRLYRLLKLTPTHIFQSTHPLRGATRTGSHSRLPVVVFQSTHPLRGATATKAMIVVSLIFQSTHPLRGATAKMHKIFCAFCDNRQFYRVSPSGVPSVGALFTYSRGLQRAGAGANLPVNGCALGLRAKASAGARLPSELRKRSLFKSRRSLLAPVRAAVPFQCNSRQQRTESCPNFSA